MENIRFDNGIGESKGVSKVELENGWKRCFENDKYQIVYTTREFPNMKNKPVKVGRYVLVDTNRLKELLAQGKKVNYEDVGGAIGVTSREDGFEDLEKSAFPEDAKAFIKKHFQEEVSK